MNDYFVYLPYRREPSPRECIATGAGCQRVLPGSHYPPVTHPIDHCLTWSEGRILHAYQILFVTEGSGVFESAPALRRIHIRAGMAFVLFPGVWHRYAPNTGTGWVEHWIECRGRAFDRAKALGIIRPEKPVTGYPLYSS